MSFDSKEMARRGRIGALVTNSRYDARALTAHARARFIAGFAEKAKAEALARGEQITDEEAARRGEFGRRAWYAQKAAESVAARRRRARNTPPAETAA